MLLTLENLTQQSAEQRPQTQWMSGLVLHIPTLLSFL
jgi:hypothetical protein